MATILKISEATTLALHAMIYIAANSGKPVSTSTLAKRFNASAAHLSKVMQRLTHFGFLKSQRGPAGGFVLTRSPKQITLLEIYEAIEGAIPDSTCLFDEPVCDGKDCILADLLKHIHKETKSFLKNTTIDARSKVFK